MGHAHVIAELAKHGADLDIPNNNGTTPAMIAAQNGQASVIKELIKFGANFDLPVKTSADDMREFASACTQDVIDRMNQFILSQSISSSEQGLLSVYPYDIAVIMGHQDVIELFNKPGTKLAQTSQKIATLKRKIDDEIDRLQIKKSFLVNDLGGIMKKNNSELMAFKELKTILQQAVLSGNTLSDFHNDVRHWGRNHGVCLARQSHYQVNFSSPRHAITVEEIFATLGVAKHHTVQEKNNAHQSFDMV